MAYNAKELGAFLRKTREEKGISLDKLAGATSIRKVYLEAIEEGTIGSLLSWVYARGFVLQVASFLAVSDHELVRGMATVPQKDGGVPPFAYGIGTLEVRSSPMRYRSTKSGRVSLLLVFLAIALLSSLAIYWEII